MKIGDYPVRGKPYWMTMTGVAALACSGWCSCSASTDARGAGIAPASSGREAIEQLRQVLGSQEPVVDDDPGGLARPRRQRRDREA